jgi:hypothetical protein
MRKIRASSEDEMIALFLQTEFHSSRFHHTIETLMHTMRVDPCVVQTPDWHNADENGLRRALFGKYRGYGRNEDYFQGFPAQMRWEWVTLTRREIEQVRYIVYDYWVELSGGTRLAVDGARNALAGKIVFRVSSSGLIFMADELRRGAQFPPLILVTKEAGAPLVVMEGHVRLTAYLIVLEYLPSELEVLLGTGEQMSRWGCY